MNNRVTWSGENSVRLAKGKTVKNLLKLSETKNEKLNKPNRNLRGKFTNRIQEFEDRILCIEDKIEGTDNFSKEKIISKVIQVWNM